MTDPKQQAAAILEQQLEETHPNLDATTRRSLARLGAAIATKKDEESDQPAQQPKPQTAQIVQLPLWPEQTRGTPNTFLRGALFAAIQGKERRALKGRVYDPLYWLAA